MRAGASGGESDSVAGWEAGDVCFGGDGVTAVVGEFAGWEGCSGDRFGEGVQSLCALVGCGCLLPARLVARFEAGGVRDAAGGGGAGEQSAAIGKHGGGD